MTAAAIGRDEYLERQRRFAEALCAQGLDGAVVVSRGGSTLDRYAQVFYLTGHYQHYSYLPDVAALFSGRAHTALVISADGATILCVAVPEYEAAEIAAGDIRHSPDFVGTLVGALDSLGLAGGKLGLVGSDVLPLHYWRLLAAGAPAATWIDCDETLNGPRRIKSPAEIAIVREAAAIHRRAVTALLDGVEPGRTEADLAAALAACTVGEGCGVYFTSISSGEATRPLDFCAAARLLDARAARGRPAALRLRHRPSRLPVGLRPNRRGGSGEPGPAAAS